MLSVKYSDWGKCKRMSVDSIFVLYFWFSFVYFWNLLINQMNFSEADSAYSTHVFQDLAQLLLDPEPFRVQVTVYHAEDRHSLGFISLFLLLWPAGNTVYSVFWFPFCRIVVPSVFHLRTSYNSSCLAPPSDILLRCTLEGLFAAMTSLVWLFTSQAEDILQLTGPRVSLFYLTFSSSPTLHSSHCGYLVLCFSLLYYSLPPLLIMGFLMARITVCSRHVKYKRLVWHLKHSMLSIYPTGINSLIFHKLSWVSNRKDGIILF